ncbi:TetR family transcriptional regulator [Streptacidiphilus jiangxiensis]|uniref:DNA-binding transcriptional regulator, AcrR family n=1 Tax=Streptacidiphilus jiangxiensis TaxID=235985 RepID=A0A1H7L1Z0_STRJI|nr:TetR family transcriptional regulator [Streptacidiphilus jiangxiensis]SEK93008.1 DNA-binding transcriptional regulator, AcrR family [Streptacidiphilus jiangxiensis]
MSETEETAKKPAQRRTGRRPGGADTRGAVLEAARSEFAARGYERSSMRGIARVAGVDAALLHHYFGSKEQLFLAALDFPIEPGQVVQLVLSGEPSERGERLARFVLALWEQPEVLDRLLAVLRTAVGSEQIAQVLREFMVGELIVRLAAELGGDQAELRAELVLSQIIGLAVARYVIRAEPIASATADELVPFLGATLQGYLGN